MIGSPPEPFDLTHYDMGEDGTITLGLQTVVAVLRDVSRSLWRNGFRRIVLLNGHGGDERPTWSAAVKPAEEDVWPPAPTDWHKADPELLAWGEADGCSIGHAGEWETSLQLHLRPRLVDAGRAVRDEWRTGFSPEVARFARYPERRREMEHGVMGRGAREGG